MITQLDKAIEAFKSNPTPANAWAVQVAMVKYQNSFNAKQKEKLPKTKNSTKLKTRKGAKYDKLLQQIVKLFTAMNWEVVPHKSNAYLESWKVTTVNLDQAILYLGSDGFSMGGKKPGEILKGEFEGYEDKERLNDFLVSNDIELED